MITADAQLFARLETFYDAVPRGQAQVESFGALLLFIRNGSGFPYYARPAVGAGEPTAADLAAVLKRQQELDIPQAFEWVHETTPGLLAVAQAGGLKVLQAPLMVLDPANLPATTDPRVRILDPAEPTFAADVVDRRNVANIGFSNPGTAIGAPGADERDSQTRQLSKEDLDAEIQRHRTGATISALAQTPATGPAASGLIQRVEDIAEIVGVATLPTARRRGLGAAVTAALARQARHNGVDLVFLSAGSVDVARVYQGIGFERIGTACIAEPA